MLADLLIKDIAIIEELRLSFSNGLNVITGETGAGKSIIVGALGLALGDRAATEDIRTGAESAEVEAVFDVSSIRDAPSWLDEAGVAAEGNELAFKRQLSRKGRNRALINGSVVNLPLLASLSRRLVDIHGQHEHQSLLHPENHLYLLDAYGDLDEPRRSVEERHRKLQTLEGKLRTIRERERSRADRVDLLRFQISEIEGLRIKPGEIGELEKQREILSNAQALYQIMEETYSEVYSSENSILDRIIAVLNKLGGAVRIDESIGHMVVQARVTEIYLKELADIVRKYADEIEFDPAILDRVMDRLDAYRKLQKKYGPTEEDILKFQEAAQRELEELEREGESGRGLEQEIESLKEELQGCCADLSRRRRQAAEKLASAITSQLKSLDMDRARFKVSVEQEEDPKGFIQHDGKVVELHPTGIDRVEFLFSPNVGEELKPLSRIASGGEISRVMLAIKTILAHLDMVPTLIFDEVDAGISGGAAKKIGDKLKELSRSHQVFCITHLPQIAGRGDQHYHIYKEIKGGRTITRAKKLSYKERVEEIARMAGKGTITATTRRHAEEMLKSG